MALQQSGPTTKWPYNTVTLQQSGPTTKWPYNKVALQQSDPTTKWLFNKMTLQQSDPSIGLTVTKHRVHVYKQVTDLSLLVLIDYTDNHDDRVASRLN